MSASDATRGKLTRASAAWLAAMVGGTIVVQCSLFTSLDDLRPLSTNDGGMDGAIDQLVAKDAADAFVPFDAADAAVPPGSAVAIGAGGMLINGPASGAHACAVAGFERALFCWGANDRGQLGNGSTGNGTNSADLPVATKLLSDATNAPFTNIDTFAVGAWNTCALRSKTQLYCWGQRLGGGVGDGVVGGEQSAPENITGFAGGRFSLGATHGCAVINQTDLRCWGNNHSEQLGHALFSGGDQTCKTFFDPAAACNPTPSTASPVNPAAISMATMHSCALVGGQVQCWGYQGEGATTGSGLISTSTPVVVQMTGATPLTGITQLSSTGRHNCAVRMPGNSVWCWGQNDAGQAGQPANAGLYLATQVAGLQATSVAVGERATCAITSSGMPSPLVCWGDDTYGQLGDGTKQSTATPTPVKGPGGLGTLNDVKSVAVGYSFACALTGDKNVWCWGRNDHGQLGDGTTVDRPFPVRVTGLP